MTYRNRLIDGQLNEFFPELAAISLEGPKGVGKTATAMQRAQTILRLDDPSTADLLSANPDIIRSSPSPVLIDEWQEVPSSWDMVRREVDRDGTGGRFLLTGSAVPSGARIHSGAGRIVSLRMRPLSLAERSLETPTVSLATMFTGESEIAGVSSLTVQDYFVEIVASGFPGIRHLSSASRALQLDSYIERVITKEFVEQGLAVRRPAILRAWLAAFAASTATTASYNTMLEATTPRGEAKPSRITTSNYRDVLERLWLIDSLPAWIPSKNTFTRLAAAPKHFLADPALAARILGIDETSFVKRLPTGEIVPGAPALVGGLFEALAVLSIKTYAQVSQSSVSHFREPSGTREIDMIVHRPDGAAVAFEVKLGRVVDDRDVRHLLWLKKKLGEDLRDMAVVYTGEYAYRRPDGVAVVPASLLGP